jgi:hypothetical protein
MNAITPLGWVFIVFLGAVILATNLSLLTALRKPPEKGQQPSPWKKVMNTARDPFGEEDGQWRQLAAQVQEFKKHAEEPGLVSTDRPED